MSVEQNILVARKTLQIIKSGSYFTCAKTVNIKDFSDGSIYDVKVFDKDSLDKLLHKKYYRSDKCKISIINEDSFVASKALVELGEKVAVMNFANAIVPGGGFLQGSSAQEESLCRNSTLYASISSNDATEMYDYNRKNLSPFDSDYMLLSEHVVVFRDQSNKLLEKPYKVSVISIPAPNKNGRARNTSQSEIDNVMKDRLHKMLCLLAYEEYKNIVLGAWGCGAFGNNPKTVSLYFHELLIDKGLIKHFDNVVFAILGKDNKVDIFKETFANELK